MDHETLENLSARHALHLHRYGTHTVNQILRLLDRVDARITLQIAEKIDGMTQREIADFLADNYTTKRLVSLRENIREMAAEARKATGQVLGNNGRQLSDYKVDQTQAILRAMGKTNLGADLSYSQVYAAARSRPFQGRHLKDMVADIEPSFRRQLAAEIREGMIVGESSDKIVRRIRGTVEQNRKDGLIFRRNRGIETLVRTSMTHISNAAAMESYRAAEVEKYVYSATLDGRTTMRCATLDRQVFEVGSGPMPPQHPNCRSTTLPYVGELTGMRPSVSDDRPVSKIPKDERDDKIKRVRANTSFAKWFDKQPAAFQKEWLGPSRYKLYKTGDYPLTRMVDPRGKTYTLDQLRAKDAAVFEELGIAA